MIFPRLKMPVIRDMRRKRHWRQRENLVEDILNTEAVGRGAWCGRHSLAIGEERARAQSGLGAAQATVLLHRVKFSLCHQLNNGDSITFL